MTQDATAREPRYSMQIHPKDLTPSPLQEQLVRFNSGYLYFDRLTVAQYQELTGDQDCISFNDRLATTATDDDGYTVYITTADAFENETGAFALLCDHWPEGGPIPRSQRRGSDRMTPDTVWNILALQSQFLAHINGLPEPPPEPILRDFFDTARAFGITRDQLIA